jgi:hypothetical protein
MQHHLVHREICATASCQAKTQDIGRIHGRAKSDGIAEFGRKRDAQEATFAIEEDGRISLKTTFHEMTWAASTGIVSRCLFRPLRNL